MFVIGAGSGGVRASRIAGSLGVKVAVCEDLYMGGTCVNVGCVPKKLYVYAAEYAGHFLDARGFGWQSPDREFDWQSPEREFDWPTLRENKKTEISRLKGIYDEILGRANVEIIH